MGREHGVICDKYPAKWDDITAPNARLKFDKKGENITLMQVMTETLSWLNYATFMLSSGMDNLPALNTC